MSMVSTIAVAQGEKPPQERSIAAMQMKVNEKAGWAVELLYDVLSDSILYGFQQEAWDTAGVYVSQGKTMVDFQLFLYNFYHDSFDLLFWIHKPKLVTEVRPSPLPTNVKFDESWLWDHVDSVYFMADTLFVIAVDSSKGQQRSVDLAKEDARSTLLSYIRPANNLPDIAPLFLHRWIVVKQCPQIQKNGVYKAVVLMKIPLSENLK